MSLVWGEKAILDELERLLRWRPSRSWLKRWSHRDHPNRLPVKLLGGRVCADVAELAAWIKLHVLKQAET